MTDRERLLAEIASLTARLDSLHVEYSSIVVDEESSDALTVVGHHVPKARSKDGDRLNPERARENANTHASTGRTIANEETVTVVEARAPKSAPPKESAATTPSPAPTDGFYDRYVAGDALGEGGMGEVKLCRDTRIGRSVAIKIIRPEIAKSKKLRARFLFEAKIQGQLEHPSIVPVYDLGVRPDGYEYFTMKRVRGRTLHEVLKDLRLGDRGAATAWWTRRKLLAAFQTVCLAIEHAHQRGVIHRDLKPANVMLGDLGEVSVLDWGLAKASAKDAPMPTNVASAPRARDDETAVGEVLGTPGYMSPEQAADSGSADAQSDVFALGSILFEILTNRSLIQGQSSRDVARMTLTGKFERSIAKRYPELDVPPELDAIVIKATAQSTKDRYERAREIADAVERFLEGDRDGTRRRSIAGKHTREAIAALAESVEAVSTTAARAARTRAIREVNQALALDPQNQTALRTMMKILTDLPNVTPPEAKAAALESEARSRPALAKRGAIAYLMVCANLLMTLWLGVVSIPWLALTCAFFLGAAAISFNASRKEQATSAFGYPLIVLTSCGIAMTSALFGPFVFLPGLCAANVVVFAATERKLRWMAIAAGLLAILLPVAAEFFGPRFPVMDLSRRRDHDLAARRESAGVAVAHLPRSRSDRDDDVAGHLGGARARRENESRARARHSRLSPR